MRQDQWARPDQSGLQAHWTAGPGPAGPNTVPQGTLAAPSINFQGDTDTGIFSPGPGQIALVQDGVLFLHGFNLSAALGRNALAVSTGRTNVAVGFDALCPPTQPVRRTSRWALPRQLLDVASAIGPHEPDSQRTPRSALARSVSNLGGWQHGRRLQFAGEPSETGERIPRSARARSKETERR